MGGIDKGLVHLRGRPLFSWALERLAPQVDEILISANRNVEEYRRFGYPVVGDTAKEDDGGYAGPLAGLQAGMQAARYDWLLTVPCDSPFLPADLVQRLYQTCSDQGVEIAVAKTGDQVHPVFSLCRCDLLPHLTDFLQSGGRKFDAWYASLNAIEVGFDDEAAAFSNINTAEDLRAVNSPTQ